MNNRKLNDLLKEWADRRPPDAERKKRLDERMLRALVAEKYTGDTPPALDTLASVVWNRLTWAVAGALGAFALLWFLRVPAPVHPEHNGVTILARIAPEEIRAQRMLFQETSALFNDRLHWIVQTANDIQLGIQPGNTAFTDAKNLLLIRLVVVKKTGSETHWENVWQGDVLAADQEVIRVGLGPHRQDRLSVWSFPNADGTFTVESRLSLERPVQLATESDAVCRPGRPRQIALFITGDAEYRIFQTLDVLSSTQGSS